MFCNWLQPSENQGLIHRPRIDWFTVEGCHIGKVPVRNRILGPLRVGYIRIKAHLVTIWDGNPEFFKADTVLRSEYYALEPSWFGLHQ